MFRGSGLLFEGLGLRVFGVGGLGIEKFRAVRAFGFRV